MNIDTTMVVRKRFIWQFNGCKVVNDFKEFSEESDVILANRLEETLNGVKDKVYTRDLYSRD